MSQAIKIENGMQKIASTTLVHPPSIKIMHKILPIDEIVEGALNKIVTVSDQTAPEVQAMAQAFKKTLRSVLKAWMSRAAINERELCIKLLRDNGLDMAAQSLVRNNYQPE